MAIKQTSTRIKKAVEKVGRGATNRPLADSEREPQRGNRRARSHSGTARSDRAGATGQAEVRVVMEKSAHRHTWIASVTRILHYCEAAGLFDSNEPLCPVATAPVSTIPITREPYTLAADRKSGSAAGLV